MHNKHKSNILSLEKTLNVALYQRICPPFRIPVWNLLARRASIALTLYHGTGYGTGSSAGSTEGIEFNVIRLPSIKFSIKSKLRVLHFGLLYSILANEYDVVISEGLTYFPNSLLLALLCKLFKIPFILYEAPPVGADSKIRKVFSPLYRHLSTSIITYTSWGKKYFAGKGFCADNITVALNTIDTISVQTRLSDARKKIEEFQELFGTAGNFVIGYLGSIEERKLPHVLLNSVIDLIHEGHSVRLLFIGDGTFRSVLEHSIPDNYSNSIFILGRQDSPEKFLQLCSLLVLPSQGGLAIPHALTCGIPCIATEEAEGPGIRDYIQHGFNGIILDSPIELHLTDTLRDIIASPKKLALLRNGAQNSSSQFSVDKMISQIETAILQAHSRHTKEKI